MKAETRAFIEEYKTHKEWEKKCKSNLINMNDYFKYSGKIENDTNFIDRYESENYTHKYGVMLKKPYILKSKDPVVRHYFQNPEESLYSIASRFNCSYAHVRVRISKYLKTRKDEKGNEIFA